MRSITVSGLVVLALLTFVQPVLGAAMATKITKANVAELIMDGPKAWGGIDDYFLTNGILCAVISDPSHEMDLTTSGGYLIDLGFCGRGDDQYLGYQFVANMSQAQPFLMTSVAIGEVTQHRATIMTKGQWQGISLLSEYTLDTRQPNKMAIKTTLQRVAEGERLFGFTSVSLSLDSHKQFHVSLPENPQQVNTSRGFSFQRGASGISGLASEAVTGNTMVYLGVANPGNNIAYGQHITGAYRIDESGQQHDLPLYFRTDRNTTTSLLFTEKFWFGKQHNLGTVDLLQSLLMDLERGESLVLQEQLIVGKQATVAAITDQVYSQAAAVRGSVGEGGAHVHINSADGKPFTHTISQTDGSFSARLPSGDYSLSVRSAGRDVISQQFSHDAGTGTALGRLDLSQRGLLEIAPVDGPTRLTFIGINGSKDPDFGKDLYQYVIRQQDGSAGPNNSARNIYLGGVAADISQLPLPFGDYRVLASRGPEYSVTQTQIAVQPKQTTVLTVSAPLHQVKTPGYLSADFHVHSGRSFDNAMPIDDRLLSYVAQGGEVLVATEHENLYDFSRDIQRLGLQKNLVSIIGTEMTGAAYTDQAPHTMGHANAFPLPLQPLQYRRGQPVHEGQRWRDVIGRLQQIPSKPIVQLNHARQGNIDPDHPISDGAYFSHLGPIGQSFDTELPLGEFPNSILLEANSATGVRDIDFDILELMNGAGGMPRYEILKKDWFALLNGGIKIFGAANSDSHGLMDEQIVLEPRNMVAVQNDQLATYQEGEFINSIRKGNFYGTTGPMLELAMTTASGLETPMGRLFSATSGILQIKVKATDWVQVDKLKVYVNGELSYQGSIKVDEQQLIPLDFSQDGYVVVEVLGPRRGIFKDIVSHYPPVAFSNPIFIDFDGDGRWHETPFE